MEPLLASSFSKSSKKSPSGESFDMETFKEVSSIANEGNTVESTKDTLVDSSSEYVLLQRRILLITLLVSAISVCGTAIFFDVKVSVSILVGCFAGLLYLRLLGRSIGNLGKSTSGVSKVQLLVPVLLVLIVSRSSELQLLPSLLGFFLYKPSLIIQFLLEP